jgi:protein ImuB
LARRILALHLPLITSERVRRQHAAPPETPFATIARDGGSIRLAAVDALARAQGLAPGLTLADARARLPQLHSLPHDPAADLALLEWLADACDRYTPMVAVRPPFGVLLDITGCSHPYGGEAGLAEDLHRRLQRLGLTAGLAIAATPDAALALAEHQSDSIDALPVSVLAVGDAAHLALRRAGLTTIAAVARQPRPVLAARFGAGLVASLDRLLGAIDQPLSPRRAVAPVSVTTRFAAPVTHSDAALAAIEALAVRAGLRLAERAEGGRRFDVALFRSDGHVARLSVETASPLRDATRLIALLQTRIGALADPLDPGFGYDVIRLDVPVVAPMAALQLDLAGGDLGDSEVMALVDRLGARLGRGRIRRLVNANTHIPEQAAFDLPLGDGSTPADWPSPAIGEPPWRPIRLFDPPQPIEVIAEVPDGPPRRFRWRRRLHEIIAHEGPERIAAEWWRRADGAGLTRDYFRIEDSQGQRFWVFRHGLYGSERAAPGWFLHGVFA